MFSNALGSVRRSVPTIAIAGILVVAAATSGATAALVITGNDIKNNTVTTKDIKDNNLKSNDIKNGSLKTSDFKASALEDLEGATGPAGPAGAPGVSGYQIVTVATAVAVDSGATVTASCPTGKRVLGAAAELTNSFDGTGVDIDPSGTRATAAGFNFTDAADTLTLDLVCANVL